MQENRATKDFTSEMVFLLGIELKTHTETIQTVDIKLITVGNKVFIGIKRKPANCYVTSIIHNFG